MNRSKTTRTLIVVSTLAMLAGFSLAAYGSERMVAHNPDNTASITITLEQGECPDGTKAAEYRNLKEKDSPVIMGCWTLVTGYVLTIWPDHELVILPPEAFSKQEGL